MGKFFDGDTGRNHMRKLLLKLEAVIKLVEEQPQQIVNVQVVGGGDADDGDAFTLLFFNLAGDEITSSTFDSAATVDDLQRTWKIDDVCYSLDDQVRVANDLNAY